MWVLMDKNIICPICLNDVDVGRLQINEGLLDRLTDLMKQGVLDTLLINYQDLFDEEVISLLAELKNHSKNLVKIRKALSIVLKELDEMQVDIDNKLVSVAELESEKSSNVENN